MKNLSQVIILCLIFLSIIYSIKVHNKHCSVNEDNEEDNIERCQNCCEYCYPPKGSLAPVLLLCKESCPDFCCEYMGCEKKECPYTQLLLD